MIRVILAALLFFSSASAYAAQGVSGTQLEAPAQVAPLGYQQITSLSSVATLAIPQGATTAVIVVETSAVRWRDDGISPTANVGMLLTAGSTMFYKGNLATISFIQVSTGAVVNVSYYR